MFRRKRLVFSAMSGNCEIRQGDCRSLLKELPDESVDLILTSPPYWSLRDYGPSAEAVWGGDPACVHEWEEMPKGWPNRGYAPHGAETKRPELKWEKTIPSGGVFCRKCGAWRGQLGLEPDWRMYVEHVREIFRECFRVLKRCGNLAVVLGDTFASSNGKKAAFGPGTPEKMKLGIPWRVRFALNDDGWISRDDIVWAKTNNMPSSVRTRFTCTYEMIFRFIKDPPPAPTSRSALPPRRK